MPPSAAIGVAAPRAGADDPLAVDINSVGKRVPHGNAHDVLAGLRQPIGDRAAPFVVNADDRGPLGRHARDQALLHRRVVLHRAVTIEMILAEIDENADRGIERRSEIDLIRRAFDNVNAQRLDACGLRRLEREDRRADIAAELRVHAGGRREMRDQRRGGRFAVGAGDGDQGRIGREATAFAAEQLDVADHRNGSFLRELDAPMRRRMRQRNARRQHKRSELRPIDAAQVGGRNAGGIGLGDAVGIVVIGDDIGAAGQKRAGARKPRAAQTEHGDLLTGKGRDRNHDDSYRSFRVESPASASTTETIQKRMTICGSVQPSCSK